jgi:hypothetical protein
LRRSGEPDIVRRDGHGMYGHSNWSAYHPHNDQLGIKQLNLALYAPLTAMVQPSARGTNHDWVATCALSPIRHLTGRSCMPLQPRESAIADNPLSPCSRITFTGRPQERPSILVSQLTQHLVNTTPMDARMLQATDFLGCLPSLSREAAFGLPYHISQSRVTRRYLTAVVCLLAKSGTVA